MKRCIAITSLAIFSLFGCATQEEIEYDAALDFATKKGALIREFYKSQDIGNLIESNPTLASKKIKEFTDTKMNANCAFDPAPGEYIHGANQCRELYGLWLVSLHRAGMLHTASSSMLKQFNGWLSDPQISDKDKFSHGYMFRVPTNDQAHWEVKAAASNVVGDIFRSHFRSNPDIENSSLLSFAFADAISKPEPSKTSVVYHYYYHALFNLYGSPNWAEKYRSTINQFYRGELHDQLTFFEKSIYPTFDRSRKIIFTDLETGATKRGEAYTRLRVLYESAAREAVKNGIDLNSPLVKTLSMAAKTAAADARLHGSVGK